MTDHRGHINQTCCSNAKQRDSPVYELMISGLISGAWTGSCASGLAGWGGKGTSWLMGAGVDCSDADKSAAGSRAG